TKDGVNNGQDNPKLGAFMAFDPIDAADPPVVLAGRDCPGFDLGALRKRYRSIVQNYRILACDGAPLPWKDGKRASAAAVGLDKAGHVVFIHSQAPHQMTELARFIARPDLRIGAAMYVEGGHETSLFVSAGAETVSEHGSFGFFTIPNIIGF